MNRSEHLTWAKERALEYVAAGDVTNAFASLTSDLQKHPETNGHSALALGMVLAMAGHLETPTQMRDFIDECN